MTMEDRSRQGRVHELVDDAERAAPSALAVVGSELAWTYRDLAAASWSWAAWLRSCGVTAGDRVVTVADNHPELVALLHGASRIGATYVPLSPRLRPYHAEAILDEIEPAILLVDREGHAALGRWEGRAEDLDGACATRAAPRRNDDERPAALDGAPALIVYTSGSTAHPRGVVCPDAAIRFAVEAIHRCLAYRSTDRIYCCLPMSFDYGLYQALLAARAGATLVLDSTRVAGPGLLRAISSARPTVVPVTTPLASILGAVGRRGAPPDLSVRLVTNTGADLPETHRTSLRARFPRAALTLMYGLTECKRVSIATPDRDLDQPRSVGRPLAGTQVRVVGDDGEEVAVGSVGELVVSGPHLMAGYWRDPVETARRFALGPDGTPLLRTGDLGFVTDEGELVIEGRTDGLYKANGVRVSLIEIEAAALEIDGVTAAIALAPTPDHPATLAVQSSRSASAVLRALHERLEPEKVPARCVLLDQVPTTTSGKWDRRAVAVLVQRS